MYGISVANCMALCHYYVLNYIKQKVLNYSEGRRRLLNGRVGGSQFYAYKKEKRLGGGGGGEVRKSFSHDDVGATKCFAVV